MLEFHSVTVATFFVFYLVEKRSDVSPVEYEEGQSEAIEG